MLSKVSIAARMGYSYQRASAGTGGVAVWTVSRSRPDQKPACDREKTFPTSKLLDFFCFSCNICTSSQTVVSAQQ